MQGPHVDTSKWVNRFRVRDRVRVKQRMGANSGQYGTITSIGGDDGTYYGVKLDKWPHEMGFSEYELESAR